MKDKDLSKFVPVEYRRPGYKFVLSPKAHEAILTMATEMSVDDLDQMYSAVAKSAGSFVTSGYFTKSKWFRDRSHHPFVAARLNQEDQHASLRLVISVKDGRILSEDEIVLPDGYYDERVVEESKVEYTSIVT